MFKQFAGTILRAMKMVDGAAKDAVTKSGGNIREPSYTHKSPYAHDALSHTSRGNVHGKHQADHQ